MHGAPTSRYKIAFLIALVDLLSRLSRSIPDFYFRSWYGRRNLWARGCYTAVPLLGAGMTASRLAPADSRPLVRTQNVITSAPYPPPQRDPPLQELPQNVLGPQVGHDHGSAVKHHRESGQRCELEDVLAPGGRHRYDKQQVGCMSAVDVDLAQREREESPVESPGRHSSRGGGREDVPPQRHTALHMLAAQCTRCVNSWDRNYEIVANGRAGPHADRILPMTLRVLLLS
ncbi:hypothetical protein EDB85DRAFT_1921501, partial [Lactarius pseudohatsudake]